jgi:hypothetical protein
LEGSGVALKAVWNGRYEIRIRLLIDCPLKIDLSFFSFAKGIESNMLLSKQRTSA